MLALAASPTCRGLGCSPASAAAPPAAQLLLRQYLYFCTSKASKEQYLALSV
jgi:hypothetical protein